MNSSTRHKHVRNIRSASSDKFDEEVPRSVFGGGGAYGKKHSSSPRWSHQSTTVLDALTDEKSELARFLFVGQEEDDSRKSSWFRSFRNLGRENMEDATANNGGGVKSMGTTSGCFLTLAMEPMEVRNERVLMVAEAFAIFGALFLGGMWIVWEWGSAKAYGSSTNEVVNRAFEAIMAGAISCNIMLALFGSVVWIMSIIHNGTSHDFVFDSRKMLSFCSNILLLNVILVTLGLFLGIYSNLSPNFPEKIVVMCMAAVIYWYGFDYFDKLNLAVSPLEVYHMPWLMKALFHPELFVFPSAREKLERRAKLQAQVMRERAYHERKTLDPNFSNKERSISGLGCLIRNAARNLGRDDYDFSVVEERLKEDWFNEADQLKGRSVDF